MTDLFPDLTGENIDTMLRLLVAAVVGMVIGLNRDLNGKPVGMRTLGLVSMGAALAAVSAIHWGELEHHPDAASRVVQGILQGILAGIGFLGAGVILHDRTKMDVHGLTTAATVWTAAALGIACALAAWHLVVFGTALTLFILIVMKPVENMMLRLLKGPGADTAPRSMADDRPAAQPNGDA